MCTLAADLGSEESVGRGAGGPLERGEIAGAATIVASLDPTRETLSSRRSWSGDAVRSTLRGDDDGEEGDVRSSADADASELGELLPPGFVLGRYRIAEPIGSGGMGVVYRAYDPELDRWLAIKVLREDRRARPDKARFLREAQAMARLSHPNVVPVHDVGSSEVGLFLAMELVEGTTLRGWIEAEERSWREVVELFIAAGRGLAEAHAAGIVHRDFKPENVLVDDRGRPRVTDFGLARPEVTGEGIAAFSAMALGSSALTRSGTIMGTPAYMAPEQLKGAEVDARTDLFAFCIVLFEALYGSPPYGGTTLGERLAVIVDGKLQEAPRRGVPRWLHRALLRGLASSADDRWPSMKGLLEALEAGLRRRRSLWLAALGLPGLALLGLLGMRGGGGEEACVADSSLAEIWSEERSATIGQSFSRSGLPYAELSWSRSAALLGDYAEAWIEAREGSCLAHRRGEISSELLDRRALCLDQRRVDLGLTVDALEAAEPGTIERAVDLVVNLEAIDECNDPAVAEGDSESSESHQAWAEDVRVRLSQARILRETGRPSEAHEAVQSLLREIEGIGDEVLRLEVLLLRAQIRSERGDYEEAEADLQEVFAGAHGRGLDRLATRAAAELVHVSGEGRAHYRVGEAWAKIALAGALRIGDDGREEARARQWYGAMLSSDDRIEPALSELTRAFEIRRELFGPEHRLTTGTATSLGNVLWKAGRLEESIATHRRSLESREAVLGPDHPSLVPSLGNLGVALLAVGRLGEAREVWVRARDLVVANYSADHPNAAVLEANLGSIAVREGDLEAAKRHLGQAVKVARAAFGEHPDTAMIIQNLGDIHLRAGELGEAERAFTEALAMTNATVGAEHSNAAQCELSLARTRQRQGRSEEARALVERALASTEASLGSSHGRVAEVLMVRASFARESGDLKAATEDLLRARAILEEGEAGPLERGEVLFRLGQAMIEAGERTVAAEGMITRATALAGRAGSSGDGLTAEITAWREGHPDGSAGP